MAIVTQTQGGQSSAVINGQSLDYISQQVLQQCSGCPDSLAQSVLQNVIRDFYYKSTGWQEIIGPYTILQGVVDQYLNPVDQYSQCHLVLDAFVFPDFTGGQQMRWLTPLARKPFGPGSPGQSSPNAPYWYWMDGPDHMVLYPTPDKPYGNILYMRMALMPVLNTGRLPNRAITHHFDGLFYGTLYRLCSMPNKPWTVKDMSMLSEWRRIYRQSILLARDIANRSFSSADAPTAYPNFAGRYSQSPQAASGSTFSGATRG
jgi:hypothetical protein